MSMKTLLIQTAIAAMWGFLLVQHTRRLFRLAHVKAVVAIDDPHLRQYMQRVWWWLGREEFWHKVQADTGRCLEIMVMILLLAWML